MLALLRRLANECDASTDSRPWTAKVGLAGGAVVELGRVRLDDLPTVVLEDRKRKAVTYTTLRDVVHIELAKGGIPRLEHAVRAAREDEALT
jgi:hypothetical protein